MLRKTVCIILLALSAGIGLFAQEWFDISTPSLDRKACLVSTDYGRVGYRAAVDLINKLSGNRARDATPQLSRETTGEQLMQLSLELFLKAGKTGTYLMVADVQSGNIRTRCYYIVCLGLENTYTYAFAHPL